MTDRIMIFDLAHVHFAFGEPLQRLIDDHGDGSQLWDAFTEVVHHSVVNKLPLTAVDIETLIAHYHLHHYITPPVFKQATDQLLEFYHYSFSKLVPQCWHHLASGREVEVCGYWDFMLLTTPIIHFVFKEDVEEGEFVEQLADRLNAE